MTGPLTDALRLLGEGGHLTADQAERAVDCILTGEAPEVAIAAFLTALKVKGETADEIAGAVAAVRARGVALDLPGSPGRLVDTCGTGGDGANTLNVSTAAALVVAACGVPVAKHGNRSASGNSGSADVLTELGVTIEAEPSILARCLAELGITFLFAPRFHPGLKFAGPVRRRLPFPTLFNLVGPLANPARPGHQLIGVPSQTQADLMASALARLGTTRSAVVTGYGGLDEVSLEGPTSVRLVENGSISRHEWRPADFGLRPVAMAGLRVSGPAESASMIRGLLGGEPGPARDVVLANAAAALWVREPDDLAACLARAAEAVDSGRALRRLEDWRVLSRS